MAPAFKAVMNAMLPWSSPTSPVKVSNHRTTFGPRMSAPGTKRTRLVAQTSAIDPEVDLNGLYSRLGAKPVSRDETTPGVITLPSLIGLAGVGLLLDYLASGLRLVTMSSTRRTAQGVVKQTLRLFAIHQVVACLASGGAAAEDAGRIATKITVNYGVYWSGLHFGDVRVVINVRDFDYEMKGDGQSSFLGGLIYEWSGGTTSAGKLSKSGPQPSLYTLSYSTGDKHSDVRISFSGGAVSDVSTSPKKRPNPKNILVTKEQLRGVLDPMTGAFLQVRPNLPEADLKVCDETIPVFDGKLRFNIVLEPKQQRRVERKGPNGYSGLAAVCGVRFVPISGFRPGDRGINFMSSHADEIEVWLVPLPSTVLYLPYRISVPTAFGSGSGEMISFQVER